MDILTKIDTNKAALDALQSKDASLLRQIRDYYRIGLTYSSNALEGNTLTESETKIVLEEGLTAGGKPLRDYYEAAGHARAYDFIYGILHTESITEQDILQIHRLFYLQIESEQAGVYRSTAVLITGSHYPTPAPEHLQTLMQEFTDWLAKQQGKMHPAEYAALAHKKLVFIHPFIDGNGRVARLLMNLCLLRAGLSIAVIPPILRSEYIVLLEKAHTNDKPFVRFITERIWESQKELLRLLTPSERMDGTP